MNEFTYLIIRPIIDVLIGDAPINDDLFDPIHMPYLRGWEISEIGRRLGYGTTIASKISPSRWQIMKSLMEKMNRDNRLHDLLKYLFQKTQFTEISNVIKAAEEFNKVYEERVRMALNAINKHLAISDKVLSYIDFTFYISDQGGNCCIPTPAISKTIDIAYVNNLNERIIADLESGNFDSVITKCRTLLEEVLIFIIEQHQETPDTSGKISKLSGQCRALLNMKQLREFDTRVNEILGGLEKIINGIASLRNLNSDSHGVGTKRINIKRREAILIANSTKTYCEYILSVFDEQRLPF